MNLRVSFTKNLFNGFFVLLILLTVHVVRAQTEGIDAGFNPLLTKNEVKATVTMIAAQADGKIVVTGDFDKINGIARNRIARLNVDGSVDANFNPGSGFDAVPIALAVQLDGKILAGGGFSIYNGASRANLIRLNADGTLDAGFTATTDQPVKAFALQSDGKIVVGGGFTTVNGGERPVVARLNVNGSTDSTFNVAVSLAGTVNSVVLDSRAGVVIAGSFSMGGFERGAIRLVSNGEYDSFFTYGSYSNGISRDIKSIAPELGGTYLVIVGDSTLRRISASHASVIESFPTITVAGSLNAVVRQPSGNILLGGAFTAVNGIPRSNLARLRPNGAIEQAFVPSGTNGEIKTLIAQSDGKTLIGGNFTIIGGIERTGIARVNAVPAVGGTTSLDFDGDAKADIAVYRPSNGFWYIFLSATGTVRAARIAFAENSDQPVPADYDGDGITNIAVWRPSNGGFFINYPSSRNGGNGETGVAQFGKAGDDPSITGDWNSDGRDDVAVYREGAAAGAQSTFFNGGINNPTFGAVSWGTAGDRPVRGDFDGDGKLDPTVFRPSNGVWYTLKSATNTLTATQFGLSNDRMVAADYDGDGKTDLAVYRPSNGFWYRLNSSNGQFAAAQFGITEDKPVPADYDGDGRSDIAVFRPSNGVWYLLRSTSGFAAGQFGIASDIPIPNIFVR
jgi:uncharacterized delta-60 repeat protein